MCPVGVTDNIKVFETLDEGSTPSLGARKQMMFKVIGKEETLKVLTLAEAMNVAKHMNEFVTIQGPDFEVVGMFGVDTVADGKCPDGHTYDWSKRYSSKKFKGLPR